MRLITCDLCSTAKTKDNYVGWESSDEVWFPEPLDDLCPECSGVIKAGIRNSLINLGWNKEPK